DYNLAQQALDKGGKNRPQALSQELQKNPRNVPLAFEFLELCELVKDSALADQITRQAVEAGSDAPELLLRHANVLAKTDPKKALGFYRKAAQGLFPPALFEARRPPGFPGTAVPGDCCYRRAYNFASDQERMRIRQALGMLKFHYPSFPVSPFAPPIWGGSRAGFGFRPERPDS
ncbi:MAG TPA: hypothetical protein VKE98_07145, partial [Gemmataceae bacterium]|nr:hypothetical protein [Gemmataceae bacterium]